jgi:ADP-ribose pyrophosphatase YjhB (NUDIX family)
MIKKMKRSSILQRYRQGHRIYECKSLPENMEGNMKSGRRELIDTKGNFNMDDTIGHIGLDDLKNDGIEKAKRMPIGTVSHGRKKVAEGKWVSVSNKYNQKPDFKSFHTMADDKLIDEFKSTSNDLDRFSKMPKTANKIRLVNLAAIRLEALNEEIIKRGISLEKSKYIKKYYKNGRWNYVYPNNGNTKRKPRKLVYNELQNLGGTTGGAILAQSLSGERVVLKQSTSPEHLKEEYVANKIYNILGVPVPKVKMVDTENGIAQAAEYIEGTPLSDLDYEERDEAIESLKDGFVADALLGNWDVLGLDEDNILWDGERAWRIDNGGSMRYRAQGKPKGDSFGAEVGEIATMRNPYMGAGRVFQDVTDEEIADQVDTVLAKKQQILHAIDDPKLRRTMELRIDSLKDLTKAKSSSKVESFTTDSPVANALNGIPFTSWSPPQSQEGWKNVEGQNYDIEEPDAPLTGMPTASGVVVEEPDGRVWVVSPAGGFGGYQNTFPKGKVDPGLSMQANAIKETWEESGLKVEITGYLTDVARTTSVTRYYTGRRVGGRPTDMGWESESVHLVPKSQLTSFLDSALDHKVVYAMEKSMGYIIPDMSLMKSDQGIWYLKEGRKIIPFWWFHGLEKATGTKSYYSPDEVKARGMRWVTIRGAHVLIQGTADGGYVVVGGAGGKLNHLKIDRVLTEEGYQEKRKKVEEKRKEETRELTAEEKAEHVRQHREELKAKREARELYTEQVTQILGMSKEDIRNEITTNEMTELVDRAKEMVEGRKRAKTIDEQQFQKEVDTQTEKEVEKAIKRKIKDVERQALDTLMNDYMPEDPNAKNELKKLLDTDKAKEILAARRQFRKKMKEIGKGVADVPSTLRVGEVYAGVSKKDLEDIEKEIKDQIETQKNIALYDKLNAQSQTIQKYVDEGSVSALNGLLGDIYGVGATFSTETVEQLGLEAIARAVTIKLQRDGKGEVVRKALEAYAETERQKVVDQAMEESTRRFENAEELRNLARDTEDAEAILSMASANGHALKQITAGQRALGTAVGSLRAVAHMINALEDPPGDVVQVDIGKDLSRARKKAKKAGLEKGTYSIKTVKQGKGKRLILEIKKDDLDMFFKKNAELRDTEDTLTSIKNYSANDGYKPPGIKDSIELLPAQEAGLRFFKEQKHVLLDFEAGLGKTAVAYSAAMEAMKNMGAKKVLIVTPAKLRGQMYDERKTFLDSEEQGNVRYAHEGLSRKARLERYKQDGIMIIGHDQLRTDYQALKDAGYDMVVVDEIHEMTAGTGGSGRYKGLMELSDIPLKIGMSGTNIKNKKKELYRKINFIDPDHTLGSMSDFEKRYKGLNQGTGIFADAANDAFRKEISRWTYTQKNNLPIKNTVERFRVPLTAQQRKAYAASERLYREERERKVPGAAAKRDSRNYEIVTDSGDQDNAKLTQMVNIMNERHPGGKAVIHVSRPGVPVKKAAATTIARLEREYGKGCCGIIDGDTKASEVRKLKKRFNDPDDPLRFIVGTKSLESGHNLQGGGTVTFHLDIPDSYSAFEQRNARVFRKGQNRDTHTYVLSGNNPLDMRGEDILETKRREQGIMGNPRGVSGADDTGFFGLLNKLEKETRSA